jgi:Leucine-rich repeat (LRR) protein
LEALDLRCNRLTSLPPEISALTNLKYLALRDNPLAIPPEVLSKTDEAAMDLIFDIGPAGKGG